MRNTKQKDLILKMVNDSHSHPTAEDVYESCRQEIPNISLGTVYRNLNQLVELNKIQRLKMPDNIDRYDKIDKHIHFICINCHKIIDIYKKCDIDYQKLLAHKKIISCKISFEGICEECLKKEGE